MRYVIYGAGAVGGVIGANLHRAGIPTTLIARGRHLEAIRADGLKVETVDGTASFDIPAAAHPSEVCWRSDTVVLVCVKSQQTAAVLDELSDAAPADVIVVSTQNGVANEAAMLRRFAHVYSICVMLPASHLEPGIVVQDSAGVPGILDVGRFPCGIDPNAEAISADLRAASFLSQARDDIMAWKYRKLLRNLGNGVDACFRSGDESAELLRRAHTEGERVIAAAGISVVTLEADDARRGSVIKRRSDRPVGDHSSTWQSVARGTGSVEIDYLAGEIVLLGRLHGVPTPVNELIRAETARLARERLPAASLDPAVALQTLDELALHV